MTLFSFIALAFGMAAVTADRVPRQTAALIAVARATRASRRVYARAAVRTSFPAVRRPQVRRHHRALRPLVAPLRGASAARAPGACC